MFINSYYDKYRKYKQKYLYLKFSQFGGNLIEMFSRDIELNIVLGEETRYWMLGHWTKNWKRLQHSKLTISEEGGKHIKGIYTLTKNSDILINALTEIFNDTNTIQCDKHNPTNCRLNVDCAMGLELIKHYILMNYLSVDLYRKIITVIYSIIDTNKTNKKLIMIYGNDIIANTIICGFGGYTHPLLAILWNTNELVVGNNDSDIVPKLSIGDSIYIMGIKRLTSEDYSSLDMSDQMNIGIIDTNPFVGEWCMILSVEPLRFVTTTSSGITYFNSVREEFNNLQIKYNNYIKSNDIYTNVSSTGKVFIEQFCKKYDDPSLLEIRIIHKKFNSQLFTKLQSSQLDENIFFKELLNVNI